MVSSSLVFSYITCFIEKVNSSIQNIDMMLKFQKPTHEGDGSTAYFDPGGDAWRAANWTGQGVCR
jgi:hypothetical protein